MTLPSSGAISTDQIRTELGLTAGTNIIIPDSVRTLAGKATGSIVLPNDLWGKSNGFVIDIPLAAYSAEYQFAAVSIYVQTNGSVGFYDVESSYEDTFRWKADNSDVVVGDYQWRVVKLSGTLTVTGVTFDAWNNVSLARNTGAGGPPYFQGTGSARLEVRQTAATTNIDTCTLNVSQI